MTAPAERPQHWPMAVQLLHWATVLLFVALAVSGWMPGARGVSGLHITLGVLLLALVLARIVLRLVILTPAPLARRRIGRWASGLSQVLLYAAMPGAISSGLAAFAPRPFVPHAELFGAVELPPLLSLTPEMRRAAARGHILFVWLSIAAVAVHIGSVIVHIAVTDRGTVRRMLGRGPRPAAGDPAS